MEYTGLAYYHPKIYEMRVTIYFSLESAQDDFERLEHTFELLRMEFFKLKKDSEKTFTSYGLDYIKDRMEELKYNSERIFWEKECVSKCINFASLMKANPDWPLN